MAVNKQRLRQMILGDGHHQPALVPAWLSANQAGASASTAAAVPCQQGHQSSPMARPQPPPAVGGQEQDQYTEFLALAAVDLAQRGATLHGSPHSHKMVAGYKRKRDKQSAPVHGAAHAQQQQQTIVVDHLLLTHASKMWETLAKQRKSHLRQVTAAAEDRAAQQLKAKDDQMELLKGVNRVLQERIKKVEMEAQAWRDAARTNDAAADALRRDLQRALDAQAVRGRGRDVDDTGSCCWGDNEHEARKPEATWWCKGCGQDDAVVVLLPCSHLCVCRSCEAATRTCPACGCGKTGSIHVNFS